MSKEALASKPAAPRIVSRYGSDLDAPTHSMLGLAALVDALAALGVGVDAIFEGTGIASGAIADPEARISHRQKIALFDNVMRLSPEPAIGLIAGRRQRISDFGVFGYAVLTSATLADAVTFGIQHVRLVGPVLEKSFRVEGEVAIFEGHDVMALGPLLPLASEFWFSSIHALFCRVLERPYESRRLLLPYPAPSYARLYEEVLLCPVEFDAGVMQWEFDAELLNLPLPNANPITADVCASFCARMLEDIGQEHALVKTIKEACLNRMDDLPRAEQMAGQLHLSTRTLHRRLVDAGTSYQAIIDGIRERLAIEFLERTDLSVDEIAERSGFSDVSNFRKAFKKWTGQTPAYFRDRGR
ncbi:AraC family transcriptional regulator [Variovorax sp. J22P240]|uniref:AraC family transcriptional regulator n=1 Tax=unclassified Variovorax TaxID=663243 RepID=UPI002577F125|nr:MULTISPECIES: AraC family transcriptional regulator [unclassified Variovorax]MDM0001992.1 AraC family transcriptional regulator [Variovorax sp. J22P240]MDM0052336.1 AraC family transcriptional regulator [Variovorax sp. J22R115]